MQLRPRELNAESIARAARLLRPAVNFTNTVIEPGFVGAVPMQHFPAGAFPTIHPISWLHSHFAVGGYSPLHRLTGMQTAHMTAIAPYSGFTWHPHRSLEIYTWVLEGTLHHEDTTGGSGEISAGEFQRMYSGSLIYHQELNNTADPVRVIQIWFAPEEQYGEDEPHYQQLSRDQIPSRREGSAGVLSLIGGDSPMNSHVSARLTATVVDPGGAAPLHLPREGEDLFLYVTDGRGSFEAGGESLPLGIYDVILARPDAPPLAIGSSEQEPLRFLSFYLPSFIPR